MKKEEVSFNTSGARKERRYETTKWRAIYIINQLATRGFVCVKELAETFGSTERNALRDLDPFRKDFTVVESAPRSGRYDFNKASYSFIKMELSDSETSSMAFMYKLSKVFGGELTEASRSALGKAYDMDHKDYPFFMITSKVKNPAAKMKCYAELYEAIQEHHKVNLTYAKPGGQATVKASPFAMILCDGLWYLGYVPEGKGRQVRTLRSSHILKVEPLPAETFERPDWARKAMKGAKNIWFSPAKTTFLLKADNSVKEYFEMSDFFPFQKIKDEGAKEFTIEARYSHFNEVVPTILRFLPAIKVIAPAELKAEVKRRVAAYKP